MHYYVVGVNGSGKTSLLKAIAAETEALFRNLAKVYNLPSLIIQNDAPLPEGVKKFVTSAIYE